MKSLRAIFLVLIVAVFAGCEKSECDCEETGNLSLNFELQNNDSTIKLGDAFPMGNVNEIKPDKLKFYLSHIKLVAADGSKTEIEDVAIIDFETPSTLALDLQGPYNNYKAIEVSVGLDPSQNASDPNTFPLDHPLSTFFGMHWSWAAKYRFVVLEGLANENESVGNPTDVLLSYHPGADDLYRTYSLPISFSIGDEMASIQMTIDFDNIFNGSSGMVDVLTENQSHTTPSDYHIAEKVIYNFGEGLSASIN